MKKRRHIYLFTIMLITVGNLFAEEKLPMDKFTYIQVDDSRTRPKDRKKGGGGWFGLGFGDITGDGCKDIVSGKWFYRNPGGDMTGKWQRVEIGENLDAQLVVDVDNDEYGDAIAIWLPKVYWIEAKDKQGSSWNITQIGRIPPTKHQNNQGYTLAQIVPGGKPEILLSSGQGVFCFQIPDDPQTGDWPKINITPHASEEGIGTGDIDGDGDIDIAVGTGVKKRGEGMKITWCENPGTFASKWSEHPIGSTYNPADRFYVGDLNGDLKADIIVAEETPRSNCNLFWFEQPKSSTDPNWPRHKIVNQYTMNSMDAADMDTDGDIDIVINQHRGPKRLQIWENDGKGNFTSHRIDQMKEGHLGARVTDMDNDGDLDILSIAWDDFQYVHLWRNDAINSNLKKK